MHCRVCWRARLRSCWSCREQARLTAAKAPASSSGSTCSKLSQTGKPNAAKPFRTLQLMPRCCQHLGAAGATPLLCRPSPPPDNSAVLEGMPEDHVLRAVFSPALAKNPVDQVFCMLFVPCPFDAVSRMPSPCWRWPLGKKPADQVWRMLSPVDQALLIGGVLEQAWLPWLRKCGPLLLHP